jgi:DUF4097 and DUF4098 domain-containing protein YvlB
MKTSAYTKWIAAAIIIALPAGAQAAEDIQTITRRFPVSGAPEIVVAIVTGGIRVTSHAGSEVVMTAKTQYEAADAASLDELKKRVRFEIEQSANNIWIGVESDNWDSGTSRRSRELGWRGKTPASSSKESGRRWQFRHDVELNVPRTAHLKLRTVNGGEIQVDGVSGEFDLNNVNGGIDVKGADGFGKAHTVNGPITLSFQRNPSGPLSVKTINGKVQLYLQPPLNADFKIKTFNAKVYSDFVLTDRPLAPQMVATSSGTKRVWRLDRFAGARAGNGGHEIAIDAFNGDVHILEKK